MKPAHLIWLFLTAWLLISQGVVAQSTGYKATPNSDLSQVDGMVVYGKRPKAGAIIRIHDEALRAETSRELFVKEALELARVNPVQIDIKFAPRSAVLTAVGRETLDLVGSALRRVNNSIGFELLPSDNPHRELRSLSKLEFARARAVIFYLSSLRGVNNEIALPAGTERKVREKTAWESDSLDSLVITLKHANAIAKRADEGEAQLE